MNEKVDEKLKTMVNEILAGVKTQSEFHVESLDIGIFVSPMATDELIKSPIDMEDLKENTGILVDLNVMEVTRGLLNRVMVRLHIDARKKIMIKNHGTHEAEIERCDVNETHLTGETKNLLHEKSRITAEAVKGVLDRIMASRADL
jgi:hypothetical protein